MEEINRLNHALNETLQFLVNAENYIENIEKFFKFKLPGRKSNLFNVRILDTGITEESLQQDISNNIIEEIIQVIPANTKLNKVDWEIE